MTAPTNASPTAPPTAPPEAHSGPPEPVHAQPHPLEASAPPLDLTKAFGPMPGFLGIALLLLLTGTAMASGLGLHEPGMNLAPVLLCVVATLSSRRMLWLMALFALTTSVLLHGRTPDWQSAGAPTLWAQWWILAGSEWMALCAGWGLGRLIERRVRLLARANAPRGVAPSALPEIPVPLVIHRDGIVLQANWAAVRLLGHDGLQEVVGTMLDLREREPDFAPDGRDPDTGHADNSAGERCDEGPCPSGAESIPSPQNDRHDLRFTPASQQLLTTDGRWLSVSRSDQWVRHGGLPAQLVCLHDEEPRRAAQELARSARSTLSALVEGHPCAMVLSDLQTTRVMLVNGVFARLVGHSADEIRGHSMRSLGLWSDSRHHDELIDRVRAGARYVDEFITLRHADGQERRLRARMSRIRIENRPALLIVAVDITDDQQRQTELQAVADASDAAVVVIREGRVVRANGAWAELLGDDPQTIVGRSAVQVLGGREPLDLLTEAQVMAVETGGGAVECERILQRVDRTLVKVRLQGRQLESPWGEDASIWTVQALVPAAPPVPIDPLIDAVAPPVAVA